MRITPLKLLAALAALIVLLAAGAAIAVRLLITPERIRTSIEAQATRALREPVAIGGADVSIYPRVEVHLRDVRVGVPTRLTAGQLDVTTGLSALLHRRVEGATLTLSHSRLDVPALVELVGRLTEAPAAAPTAPDGGGGLAIASVRSIRLEDVTLVAGGHEVRASADAMLGESGLTIRSLRADGRNTALTASGEITFDPTSAALKIDADTLSLDELIGFVSAVAPRASGAPASAPGAADGRTPHVTADVNAKRGSIAGLAFSDLVTTVVVADAAVRLDPFRVSVFGGRLDGRIDRTEGADGLHLAVAGSLAGAEVTRVLAWLGQKDDPITGHLSGSVKVGASGDATAADAWRGSATLTLNDGVLKGLLVVRAAVVGLGGRTGPAPPAGTDRYDRITGVFGLEGRAIRCTDLVMASPDLDLRGDGTIALPAGGLDLAMQVSLSPALSAQAGRDLYRYAHEGDRVVLPATIRGALGAPRVSLDTAAIAKRAIRNKVEDEAGSLLNRFLKRPKP